MKFAKEIEEQLVPEWRAKYLNYKQGKKKVKAVARALRHVHQIPKPGGGRPDVVDASHSSSLLPYTQYDFAGSYTDRSRRNSTAATGQDATKALPNSKPDPLRRRSTTVLIDTPPLSISERQPLKGIDNGHEEQGSASRNYGSFPTTASQLVGSPEQDLTPLKLPDPAIGSDRVSDSATPRSNDTRTTKKQKAVEQQAATPLSVSDAYRVGETQVPPRSALKLSKQLLHSYRADSTSRAPTLTTSPFLRRMLSGTGMGTPKSQDVPLEAYQELDDKQHEFFAFLDEELDKIEGFYRMKEDEASQRLPVLRAQLHEMRNRRMDDVANANKNVDRGSEPLEDLHTTSNGKSHDHGIGRFKTLENFVTRRSIIGKTTEAMKRLGSPPTLPRVDHDARRDYVNRVDHNQRVQYPAAKRKLKLALQEFYRGLELLKSYALVNRTAFRKINKKYDKAMNARPTGRYMTEKINQAHFVQSDIVDGYIVAIEDLYARYFERGNHKIAVGKLRSKMSRIGDYSQTSFRNGLWLAAGTALGIQGMVYGFQHLNYHHNSAIRLQTSYLLQLYGGYFLGVVLFLIFTLNCRIWTGSKINYIFVFEFDSRHVLDWRQLAELPSIFFFLNGFFIWLNFRRGGEDVMFLYWPVVLVGITLLIMCLPFPIAYHRSRKWWVYSNWRLLLAGLYPVEFRDFFLGDIYCSLTYAMGNIEIFFCLYAQRWSDPPRCNSTHSRLLGFFATLPAIWRAFQCLRRYHDSRSWFPHLANLGKYTFSVLYYMSLSLYRIDSTTTLRALFFFFAIINALYCSVWDIAMDWSLGNPYAPNRFLRGTLGYRRIWTYYAAMVLDPILRFSWIFYAIFGQETQHSTLVSFLIALAEVVRRGIWAVFRVENEHCTNVGRFRASRDVPLPYSIETSPRESQELQQPAEGQFTTGADIEQGLHNAAGSLRLRKSRTDLPTTPMSRGLHRVGTLINQAHAQDFERKNRAGIVGDNPEHISTNERDYSSDEDDEDDNPRIDDDDAEDMMQAEVIVERARG